MSEQTKIVNLELEIDTSTVDSSKNRYQGLIDLAKAVDSWRIFPRIFISTYIFLLYNEGPFKKINLFIYFFLNIACINIILLIFKK